MNPHHPDIEDDDDDHEVEVIQVHPGGKPKQPAHPHDGGRRRHTFQIDASRTEEEEVELPPSKTKVKQQMHDLQDIGEQLAALSKEQLAELDLPETLRDALTELKRIHKFGAIRRQMQYIGRLMRDVDPAPIQEKLAVWSGTSKQHVAWQHLLERWRDRLLEDADALTELLSQYPTADAQHLRNLIRNAHKEKELGKPPKNYREIFQVLRDIIPMD